MINETKTTIVIVHEAGCRPDVGPETKVLGCRPLVLTMGDLSEDVEILENRIEELEAAIREYISSEHWNGESFVMPDGALEKLQSVLDNKEEG